MKKINNAWAYLVLKNDYQDKCFFLHSDKKALINNDLTWIKNYIYEHRDEIEEYKIYLNGKNCGYSLLNYLDLDVRIEPGAIIREGVILNKGAIVLMNATINVGAVIGSNTMIDMGAVIGSNAEIGSNCHIGANAVIAGNMEPYSDRKVIIEDDCFIGANSVVLSGVKIGKGSIIGALTLVNEDVPENSVVYGIPGKIRQSNTAKDKCKLNENLRK